MISERTRDKVAASRRKGKWIGGMPILGYTVENSKLVVDQAEAQRVREILGLYLELGNAVADGRLVKELNRRDWPTKSWVTKLGARRGGTPFNKNRLYHLLSNVAYVGKVGYREEVHPGEHTAIVAEETFLQAQAVLKRNQRTGARSSGNKYGALLKGLIRCASCDCAMLHSYTNKGNRRWRYYVCRKAQQHGWTSCPAPSLPAPEIERFVAEQIKGIVASPEMLEATLEQVRQQMQSDTECNVTEAEVAAALGEFNRLWEALTSSEKTRVMSVLVEQVIYDGVAGQVQITFRPAGLASLGAELSAGKEVGV